MGFRVTGPRDASRVIRSHPAFSMLLSSGLVWNQVLLIRDSGDHNYVRTTAFQVSEMSRTRDESPLYAWCLRKTAALPLGPHAPSDLNRLGGIVTCSASASSLLFSSACNFFFLVQPCLLSRLKLHYLLTCLVSLLTLNNYEPKLLKAEVFSC